MKKLMLVVVVAGMVSCQGCDMGEAEDIFNFISIGGGKGGDTGATNLQMEAGHATHNSVGRDHLFSFGLTLSTSGKSSQSDDAADANGDYRELFLWESRMGTLNKGETYQAGPEMGIYLKYGLEVIEDTNLFVTVFGGMTTISEKTIYTSDIQVWPYEYETTDSDTDLVWGYGLSWFIGSNREFLIQVDYSDRREIIGSIGFSKPF